MNTPIPALLFCCSWERKPVRFPHNMMHLESVESDVRRKFLEYSETHYNTICALGLRLWNKGSPEPPRVVKKTMAINRWLAKCSNLFISLERT
jgi:hypothetical protein